MKTKKKTPEEEEEKEIIKVEQCRVESCVLVVDDEKQTSLEMSPSGAD